MSLLQTESTPCRHGRHRDAYTRKHGLYCNIVGGDWGFSTFQICAFKEAGDIVANANSPDAAVAAMDRMGSYLSATLRRREDGRVLRRRFAWSFQGHMVNGLVSRAYCIQYACGTSLWLCRHTPRDNFTKAASWQPTVFSLRWPRVRLLGRQCDCRRWSSSC